MTDTARNLIQRMAKELDQYRQYLMDDRRETHALANEARAHLAQSGPEGPTDQELWDLYQDLGRDFSPTCFARAVLARWGRPAIEPEPEGLTEEELDYLWTEIDGGPDCCAWRPYARAVIAADSARWGRTAIKPTPVSERLPGPEDCDTEGRCWLTSVDVEPGWVTDNPEQCTNWTHWLPHYALPVPTTTTETP